MKLTPENIVEAAEIILGEGWLDYEPPLAPGQTEFQRHLAALAAGQCVCCGSWWECDEAMENPALNDGLYCIDCAEKLSGFYDGDDITARQREGYEEIFYELRRRVTVHWVNLFQETYPVERGQDVIFCRNVMIYFDVPSRTLLVERLADMLAPGGYLIVGHSESLIGIPHRLTPVWPSVYMRPE